MPVYYKNFTPSALRRNYCSFAAEDMACWGKHAMSMGKPLRGFQAKRKSEESNFPAAGEPEQTRLNIDFPENRMSLIFVSTVVTIGEPQAVGCNIRQYRNLPKALSPSEG
jgi:hypothetical protein